MRQMPALKLGSDIGHHDCGLAWISLVKPAKYCNFTLRQTMTDSFHIFSNSSWWITLSFITWIKKSEKFR